MALRLVRAVEARAEGRAMTVAVRVGTWLHELPALLYCIVHGHDEECLIEIDRIVLRCVTCGRRSPGWRIYSER
jgi:hypothetical protein